MDQRTIFAMVLMRGNFEFQGFKKNLSELKSLICRYVKVKKSSQDWCPSSRQGRYVIFLVRRGKFSNLAKLPIWSEFILVSVAGKDWVDVSI